MITIINNFIHILAVLYQQLMWIYHTNFHSCYFNLLIDYVDHYSVILNQVTKSIN